MPHLKLRPELQRGAGILFIHGVAAYAILQMCTTGFSGRAWFTLVLMWALSAGGVTLGYHRHLTHQSFRCAPWLEKSLYVLAAFSLEGNGMWWGAVHHQHHVFTDREGDPHRPDEFGGFKGLFWSHMGWLFFENIPAPTGYTSPVRFEEDGSIRWQKRWYPLFVITTFALPFAIAGWDGLLLGGFFRIAACWHLTWSTNSFCHVFGGHAHTLDGSAQTLDTHGARNFPVWCVFNLFAILSMGEFWHANHHARQRSARFGWRWFEFDPGGWIILLAKRFGIFTHVRQST